MSTLRDIWLARNMNSTQVAAAAGITVSTLYRCNRKEDNVQFSTVVAVCKVLGLSLDEYASLDACPMSERYRKERDSDAV